MGSKPPLPSNDSIQLLDIREALAQQRLPHTIKRIYQLQGWSAGALNHLVPAISENLWRQYGQASWTKTRMLHVIAAFAWVSQTSMSAFYQTHHSSIKRTLDDPTLECIAYSSTLQAASFDAWVRILLAENHINNATIEQELNALRSFNDGDFLAPEPLDIIAFKTDYYRSIAINLQKLRHQNNLTQRDVAHVLGITVQRYKGYENEDKPISIPATLVLRLRLGFHKTTTINFVKDMHKFKGFYLSRVLQDRRESLVIQIMQLMPLKNRYHAANYSLHTANYSALKRLSFKG